MPRLFISYAREDQQWVEAFSRALIAAGFEVWRDNAIPTGEAFGRVIEQAIAGASAVVVVWSKDSVESDWVRAEATEGLRRGILIPVQRDASQPPLRFRTLQTTSLAEWRFEPGDPVFDRLVRDLRRRADSGGKDGGAGAESAEQAPRRPRVRWIWWSAAAVLLIGAAALLWYLQGREGERQLATELVAAARSERERIIAERAASRDYRYYYLTRSGGQERVERAVLLALEAVRVQRSAETLDALRTSLLLLQRPLQQWRLDGGLSRVAVAADAQALAWASRNGVWVRDLSADAAPRMLDAEGASVWALLFPDRRDHLLALRNGGGLSLWRSDDGERLWSRAGGDDRALDYALSTDGQQLALRRSTVVALVELSTGRVAREIATGGARNQRAGHSIAMSGDARHLALAAGKALSIYDLSSGAALHQRQLSARITTLAFDPDGSGLFVATAGGGLEKISLPYGDGRRIPTGGTVSMLGFSPQGRRLALASGGRVSVVAADDPQRLLLAFRHDDRITALTFSSDGERIASAGQDGDVRVFAVADARELARLSHPDQVLGMAFGAGARSLTTIGRTGAVARWPLDYDDPAQEACRRLARNLTPDEWRRFLPDRPYRDSCPLRGSLSD